MSTFRNKGIALFIALALLLLLSIGIAVFLLNTYRHVNINEAIASRARAMLVAESGIAFAYWRIRIDQNQLGGSMAQGGTYTFDTSIPMNSSLPVGWSIQVDVITPGTPMGPIIPGAQKTINSKVTYAKSTVFP